MSQIYRNGVETAGVLFFLFLLSTIRGQSFMTLVSPKHCHT